MKLTKEGLAKLHREQTSRALREAVDCPSSELLARAAVGDLSEAEREPVTAHLATCFDCVEEYRLIAPLEAWAKQAALTRGTSTETPAIIELPKAKATDKDNVVHPIWRRQDGKGPRLMPYAMAASFLIASILLGLWVTSLKRQNERLNTQAERARIDHENELAAASQTLEEAQRKLDETLGQPEDNKDGKKKETEVAELRQRIEELSHPQFNISITDLEARGSVRGGSDNTIKTIEVAPGANFFTVILNVSGQPSFKDYVLEIQDRGGKVVSTGRGLRKSPYNTFTVMLARSSLPAGSYHLKLYGLSGKQKELIEDYAVRIEHK